MRPPRAGWGLPLLLLAPLHALAAQSGLDDANARAATEDYARAGRARVVEAGTYTMVPYGHVQPVLRCAPLRVCTALLQAGERVADHVLGDPERWVVDFAAGPDSTPLVVAKPVGPPDACDLTTNLIVTTSRRVYHFTLDSPPCRGPAAASTTNPAAPYTREIRFYYPDEALVRRHAAPTSARAEAVLPPLGEPLPELPSPAGLDDLASLHFGYRPTPDRRFPWVPRVVFDDGHRTCVRLPPEAARHELPVLYELNEAGGYELAQYVVRDGCILTDRVMRRMVLLLPAGDGAPPLRLLVVRRESGRER